MGKPFALRELIVKLLKTASSGPVWRTFVALGRDMLGVVAVGITVVLGLVLGGRGDLTNTGIAILFVIAIVSMRLGYRAAILAAGAGALSFDYFFLPPYGSIRIFHIRDMVTDAAMFCVAVLIGTLNERLRKQAESARVSERRTEALYALVKDLAAARSVDEVCVAGLGHIETVAGVSARVLIREESEVFNSAVSSAGRTGIEVGDLEVSRWVANHLEPAGQGTQSFSTASARYYPLVATRGCVGVLVLQAHGSLPTDGSRPLLVVQSMSQQLAMAIERMLLSFEKRAAEVEAESERPVVAPSPGQRSGVVAAGDTGVCLAQ